MADRPDRPRRAEVPLPPMPAAWSEPADADSRPGPLPPPVRTPASGPPVAPPPVRTPRPPRMVPPPMVPPRFAAPPPPAPPTPQPFAPARAHRPAQPFMPAPAAPGPVFGPVFGPGMPTFTPQPLTGVVPVAAPRSRPVSPIPYPGLPLSVPPMAAGAAPGVVPTDFHPETGEPLSDRSGFTAGLLQIFLGAFGAGRLYTGHVAIALLQMASGLFLVVFTMCAGAGLGLGQDALLSLLWVAMVWPVVDGVRFLGWGGHDSNGHRLR